MKHTQSAALYIRVSTDDQAAFSPEAQKRALLHYAEAHGFFVEPSNIFVDEGISGRRAEKRPAFLEMIAKAKGRDRPFDVILVHKFDRFARSREDSIVYKSLLKKECNVRVISITERMEDDKFSIILEAILEAMAEYYSINLADEVKKGMTEKALRGGLQSSPPFGYTVEANRLVPVEAEANLVKEIFRRFIQGQGYTSIAKWLNGMGVKSRRGNPFEHRTVEYILRNPVYIGKLRWNPKGKTGRDYENTDIILAEGKHSPLISEEVWAEAMARWAELKAQRGYPSRPVTVQRDWLSGMVRCRACSSTLVFVKPHYWKCNAYVKGACTHSQHIRDEILKGALLKRLEFDMAKAGNIAYTVIQAPAGHMDSTAPLVSQIAKGEKRIGRLREAYLDGIETGADYRREKQKLEWEIGTLRRQLAALQDKPGEDAIEDCIRGSIQEPLGIFCSEETDMEKKQAILRALIETCFFDKEHGVLEIFYHPMALPPSELPAGEKTP